MADTKLIIFPDQIVTILSNYLYNFCQLFKLQEQGI